MVYIRLHNTHFGKECMVCSFFTSKKSYLRGPKIRHKKRYAKPISHDQPDWSIDSRHCFVEVCDHASKDIYQAPDTEDSAPPLCLRVSFRDSAGIRVAADIYHVPVPGVGVSKKVNTRRIVVLQYSTKQ